MITVSDCLHVTSETPSYAVFKNAAMTRKWDYTAGARTCAVGMGGN